MIGLDTNVLVRYLTKDDVNQWEQASQIVQENQPCFISNVVLSEVVWVLRGRPYQFGKDEIIATLEMILQSSGFEFENRSIVYQALQRTKQGRSDFSDYLIGAIAQQVSCTETVTFDRKLRGDKGFRCL
ncbi:PIN domain-containing protein [Scytonema hofmannii]|uniref:PIN domain-containing protein n=1 Tax=Scytonema hofmannii TaxID=34078 RepID=UPI0003482CF5|nr:type II toxin-antitoxin system VapC family toxin [Scytonema hofmannii]